MEKIKKSLKKFENKYIESPDGTIILAYPIEQMREDIIELLKTVCKLDQRILELEKSIKN